MSESDRACEAPAIFGPRHFAALAAAALVYSPPVGAWFAGIGHWWLGILLRAALTTYLCVPLSILTARRFGALDIPDPRKIHAVPMPRLGGMAVLAGILLATARYLGESREMAMLLGGGCVVFYVSFLDDLWSLSARTRLWVQLGVTAALIAAGLRLRTIPYHAPGSAWWNGLLTGFWVIGLMNAINFLDGIDGLCASIGAVCSMLFLAVGWTTRQSHVALLTSALAGSCLGFLPYNWNPAVTFLGDGGAILIGFLLAEVPVWGSWSEGDPMVSFSTPLLILAIPIFDMIYTTISRIKNGQVRSVKEWLEFAAKDHLHHRLMRLRLNQREAVLFILLVNVVLGLGALAIRATRSPAAAWILVFQSVLIFGVISVLMVVAREKTPEFRRKEG